MARKICKCVVMQALLTKLGCAHAAALHGKIGAEHDPQDDLIHFDEEEEHVFPLLPKQIAAELMGVEGHEAFRAQIKVFGSIQNEEMFQRHAAREDEVILKYLGKLITMDEVEAFKARQQAAQVAGLPRENVFLDRDGRRRRLLLR